MKFFKKFLKYLFVIGTFVVSFLSTIIGGGMLYGFWGAAAGLLFNVVVLVSVLAAIKEMENEL